MLRVERLHGPQELQALAPEWEALEARLSPRTPFTSPLWNALWWAHLHEERFLVRDEFFAHAVRSASGDLVAVAPMMITHRPGLGPLRTRLLQFFGADKNVTELRGVVCRSEDEGDVVAALTRHFHANAADWDWLQWSGIRGGGAAFAALPRDGPVTWSAEIPEYWLTLPATWEAFKAGLSRNIKESLRKCYNSLKRDGHSFVFRAVEHPQDVPAAIQRFFDLHSARARVKDTVDHNDVFATQRNREFLLAYTRRMAERSLLRVFQLEIGGTVVATRIGFVLGEELYLYFSGYDYEWGKYSVMTTVVAESIQWAIAHGLKIVNLSLGNDVSKTRWRPNQIMFHYGLQASPTWRGPVVFRAYRDLVHKSEPGSLLGRLVAFVRRRA